MGKFFLLYLIVRLSGHPLVAIIVIAIIYYIIDRRYIGLLPNIMKPFRRHSRMSNLKKQLSLNPHDMSARYDLATLYMERQQFDRALKLLEELSPSMKDSADVLYDIGFCHLSLGDLEKGERFITQALELNKGLRHGEPYIRLASAFAQRDAAKALTYVQEASRYNFSSCEAYFRLGQVFTQLGDSVSARAAFQQCVDTYRALPKFRKRYERKWAVRARFKTS